jgi:hypothetical protein
MQAGGNSTLYGAWRMSQVFSSINQSTALVHSTVIIHYPLLAVPLLFFSFFFMSLTSYIAGQVFNTTIMDDLSTGSESDYSTS